MPLSKSAPAFANHVRKILGLRAEKEVMWIATPTVIARMTNDHVRRNGTVEMFVANSMYELSYGALLASSYTYSAIPTIMSIASG